MMPFKAVRALKILAPSLSMLAGCATGPQPCLTAHSPSITITSESGQVIQHLPSQTTRVCPAYVIVDK